MARQLVLEVVCFLSTLIVKDSSSIIVRDRDSDAKTCATPDDREGKCIDIRQCPSLLKLAQDPRHDFHDFLQRSECGRINDTVHVCCRFQGSALLPDTAHCGQSFENRIYGGSVTHIDEHPWTVLIRLQSPGKTYTCAGSLINNRYVLTAAHCMHLADLKDNINQTPIRLGEWNRTINPDCETLRNGATYCADPLVDVGIDEWISHPDYLPNSRDPVNDIAVVRLDRYVNFTNFIQPVCLPVQSRLISKTFAGASMYIVGWGYTETTPNALASVKRKAIVDGIDLDVCRKTFSQFNIDLLDSQICAGGVVGVDQCSGDSGGPLVSKESIDLRDVYVLVGIVSFNIKPCAEVGYPGVYTRVGSYIDWIRNTLKP